MNINMEGMEGFLPQIVRPTRSQGLEGVSMDYSRHTYFHDRLVMLF